MTVLKTSINPSRNSLVPQILKFIEFLDKTFGKGKMKECEEYLLRLKKMV